MINYSLLIINKVLILLILGVHLNVFSEIFLEISGYKFEIYTTGINFFSRAINKVREVAVWESHFFENFKSLPYLGSAQNMIDHPIWIKKMISSNLKWSWSGVKNIDQKKNSKNSKSWSKKKKIWSKIKNTMTSFYFEWYWTSEAPTLPN